MQRLEPRQLALRALAAAGLLALGVALWPVLGGASDAGFRALARSTVGQLSFGDGGFIELEPIAAAPQASEVLESSWSTRLILGIEGVPHRNHVRLNARRLAYLPLVVLASIVLVSPLTGRRKLVALAAGGGLTLLSALLTVWLTATWLFARVDGLVYQLSSLERHALDFGYEAWVTALGNRYAAPIAIAAVLIVALLPSAGQARPTQDVGRPDRVPNGSRARRNKNKPRARGGPSRKPSRRAAA